MSMYYFCGNMRLHIFLILTLVLCLIVSCTDIPEPIADSRLNDYALFDNEGEFQRLSSYNNSNGIVIMVQGNGCPIVRNALNDFKAIKEKYSKKGFKFFLINSNVQDTKQSINQEAQEFDFQTPVLIDNQQLIADALNINITAEVFILHPITRKIIYRGPINDRLDYESQKGTPTTSYLKNALKDILKNKTPESKPELSRGCKVTRLSNIEKDTLTYTQDIAPILQDYCVRCHKKDGIAPWAMTDYKTILGWSAMMEQVLISKRMPPWKADPHIGDFSNSFELPPTNRRKIIRWINSGMAYGENSADDPLKNFTLEDTLMITSRIPDTTIILKKELIPANGILPYRHQKIQLNLKEGKWLAGVTIEPGNSKVVHHSSLSSTTETKLAVNRPSRIWIDNLMNVIVSGTPLTLMYPNGSGVYIDSDTELLLQTHYTTIGVAQEDITKIHLYYHKETPEKQFFSLGIFTDEFIIEPYNQYNVIRAQDIITKDILVHSIFPHMHYRGEKITMTVTLPDNTEKTLISVSDYNFNWQYTYQLKEPIHIPKGSVIRLEGIYNNSFQNPFNPDPSQEITFGYQSHDEMLLGVVNYTLYGNEEEPVIGQ